MQRSYLHSTKKQFEYYKVLGEKTFEQLSDRDLLSEPNKDINSIAIIVNHLWGNMLSRWTNFLTSDGEKEWRQRDLEFESVITSRSQMMDKWEEGWTCLFDALDSINEDNFDNTVYIRNQEHTVVEAINRQMMHYAYHVGQIVFIGKLLKGEEWTSLSIPKGGSKAFNQEKFARGQHDGHFTDDIK